MHGTTMARRVATVAVGTTLSIAAVGGSAWASPGGNGTTSAPHQIYSAPQPASTADFSGHGANVHGPYDSTRDGSASANGNGGGTATGKPCAGCVGKADNKNPKGQLPGGSDRNAGYECDRNHGIGRGNPAHTGCTTAETPVVTPPVVTPPVVTPPIVTPPVVTPPVAVLPGSGQRPVHTPATSQQSSTGSAQVLGESFTRSPRALAVEASTATAPTTLPFTGAPTGTLLLAGLLLVGSGAAVTAAGRRSAG